MRPFYCRAGVIQPCQHPHCVCDTEVGGDRSSNESSAIVAFLCFVGFVVAVIVITAFHYFS